MELRVSVPESQYNPSNTSRIHWLFTVVVTSIFALVMLRCVQSDQYRDGLPSLDGYNILLCNQPTRSTQPWIPVGPLNLVPVLAGLGKGGNVNSAGLTCR